MTDQNTLIELEYDENEKKQIIIQNWIKMLYNRNWIKGNIKDLVKQAISTINTYDETSISYNSNTYYLKVILKKLNTIKKVDEIDNFLESCKNHYMFFIILQGSNKIEKQLLEYENVEVFTDEELLVNVIDNYLVPKHIVLSDTEANEYLKEYKLEKKNLMKIYTHDPIAKYYNIKVGQIVKIIRPSITAGEEIALRVCIPGKIY